MKELSQIRKAVLDALRGAGIQAMEAFPEKQAMAYSGVVAAVGVGAASGKTAGFCHYLGEMKDPETQAVRERYGKELFGQITVELRANRAADCERGCETATEGTLSYDALLDFWAQFDPYTMNTMLVSNDMMLAMLKLSEFQNPNTGLNFQATGKLTTPLGAKLLRSSAVPAGTIIGLDKNYALEQICGSEVVVEYDKLIDRQLERAAITSVSGFAKLFTDAAKVLKV